MEVQDQQTEYKQKYNLKLFVAGNNPRSLAAISTIRRLCESDTTAAYTLEIVDVFEQPEMAEREKILATPTLIKQLPPPLRRVIGDLSDEKQVLIAFDFKSI